MLLKNLYFQSMSNTPHTEAVGYVFGRPCYNPGMINNEQES